MAEAPTGTALHETIRHRLTRWRESFAAKDVDAMMGFYADGDAFVAYDLMPPIEIHGGDQWRQNWVYFFGLFDGPLRVDTARDRLLASGDVALYHCLFGITGTMHGGSESTSWSRTTLGLQLLDGQWLMVHDHVSVPQDLATGQALNDLSPQKPSP